MIESIIILIVLILLSSYFSGTEVAMMSMSDLRINYLVEKGTKNAKILHGLKKDKEKLLITILLGNNIVNIASSAQATALAIGMFGNYGVGIATGIMTFILLMFGEITPKSYAVNHAEKISLATAPTILFLTKALWPFVKFFEYFIKLISPLIKGKYTSKTITEDEIKNIITLSEENGAINAMEKEMIHNIFKFDDLVVKQIMVPRPDIFAINSERKISSVIKEIKGNGFSRIPVYEKEFDRIKGILYVKDMIGINPGKKVGELTRDAMVVPESKKIDKLFKEMKLKRQHIAVVVDEYGIVAGIVSIEDLLEEIVGEIYDETDEVSQLIVKKDNHTYEMMGDAEIKLVRARTKRNIGSDPTETISGYILRKIGHIPKEKEEIKISKNSILKVLKVKDNRIEKVRMIIGNRKK